MLSDFHFLQPLWLVLLPIIVLLALGIKRSSLNAEHWSKVCDPQLLPFLQQQGQVKKHNKWLPLSALMACLLLVIAAAQPVWKQVPQPVFEKGDALIIALDLSASMNATDLKPSRIQRAHFKIKDLVARLPDTQMALIVYAAEAFVVTPMTDDADTIIEQLAVMTPEIMPAPGSRGDKALLKAAELLQQAGINNGNIVLISDEVFPEQMAKATAQVKKAGHLVSILGVGTAKGAPIPYNNSFVTDRQGRVVTAKTDFSAMAEVASLGGGKAMLISVDDRDIATLVSGFQPNNGQAQVSQQELNQWLAEGPWLVLLALPLLLPLFRRGILNLLLPAFLVLGSTGASDLWAQDKVESEAVSGQSFWNNLWQTPDQQGYDLYQAKGMAQAAQKFSDPRWKQAAYYRNQNYEAALSALEEPVTASDWYNRGNTLARLGKLEEALAAYDQALASQPNFADAEHNQKLIEQLLQQQQQAQQEQQQSEQNQNDSKQSSNESKGAGASQGRNKESPVEAGEQGASQNQNSSTKQQVNKNNSEGSEQDKQEQSQHSQKSNEQLEKALKKELDQKLKQEQPSKKAEQSSASQNPADESEAQAAAAERSQKPLSDKQAAREQLLNRIEDDPGGLWRRKFIYQYRTQGGEQVREEQRW